MYPTHSAAKRDKGTRLAVPFGYRLLFSVMLAGLVPVLLCLVLLWANQYTIDHKLEGTALILTFWIARSFSAQQKFIHSLRVLTNVVGSLKEEDFAVRAGQAVEGDAFGELAIEINGLARALEEERLEVLEAASLLRTVMAEAGTAIMTFSPDGSVYLLNRAAASLLNGTEERLRHSTAAELGIEDLLEGPGSETITRAFGGVERRWLVRRTWFRRHGIQHRLLVLSEASAALRAEERLAWQRLIRVLGHEINNSLAPIKSIAHTLARLSAQVTLPPEVHHNLLHGLEVISGRAESLNRFLQNYSQLAKLPPPNKRNFELSAVIQRVTSLESRLPIVTAGGPNVMVNMDSDQIEHALINLLKNAVEAVLIRPASEHHPDSVAVSWTTANRDLNIFIRDRGIGLPQTENLFVPFYTTKKTGSGIGLILCRQVVENHGGQITIRNRMDTQGCEVRVRIPSCIVSEGNKDQRHGAVLRSDPEASRL
jgi:two-component system nitrogen regulation sensor histidine kinase NtrY